MSLAWVQAIVALFVALMVSLTGLLTATAILLPIHTRKAERSLEQSPTKCLFGGLGLLFVFFIGLAFLNMPLPLAKLIGFFMVTGITALLTLGGAGMAQMMGNRISEMSGAKTTFGALVRGSIAYSVGVFFPYIGWFVLAPLSILCALGAGVAALWPSPNLNPRPAPLGWQPQPAYAGGGPMLASMPPNIALQGAQETFQSPASYTIPNSNSNNLSNSMTNAANPSLPHAVPPAAQYPDQQR